MMRFFSTMLSFLLSYTLLVTLLLTSTAIRASDNIAVKALEQGVAFSTVLTDSDAVTFGFASLDLTEFNEFIDTNETTLKRSTDILVLPYSWKLADTNRKNMTHFLNTRVSYVGVDSDSTLVQGYKNEQIYGMFLQYSQRYQIDQNWYTGLGFGTHLSYYRNQYSESEGITAAILDRFGGSTTSALVLMAEPAAHLGYVKNEPWGQWTLHNSDYYLFGQGIGGAADNISDVQPEGWRVINGIEFKFNIEPVLGLSDYIALDLKRIDVGGDISVLSDKGYYYEVGLGWIVNTQGLIALFDNIGIGINLNFGSSISGGSLVIYYNE